MTGVGPSVLVIGGHAGSLVNFRGPLLKALAARGCRVTAAAPQLATDPETLLRLTTLGAACREWPLDRTGLNPFADLRALFVLAALMRRERPDVILAYAAKPVIFGTMAARLAAVPRRYALITGLGYAFTDGARGKRRAVRRILAILYKIAFRSVDKLFFQNPDDAAAFRELGLIPRRLPVVIVSGSGVDLHRFRPASLPPGPIGFLLVARLLSAKGIREYCAAAGLVRQAHEEVRFDLVGGVDSSPDALDPAEVARWAEAGGVRWHGEVADVRPFLEKCHVYVLPSYREGTPRSVLEAMAMERPIVTTDAPGCRETVVEGENGFLVPPRSVEPLAAAMLRFIEQPELVEAMGRRSRERAERKYDVDLVNAAMLREMGIA